MKCFREQWSCSPMLHGTKEKTSSPTLIPLIMKLQNILIEMHGDAMNSFKEIGSQKKTILKLEVENLKIKKYFEFYKKEHMHP